MRNLISLAVIGIVVVVAVVVTIVILTGGDSGPKPDILILVDTSATMEDGFEDGSKIQAAVAAINDLVSGLQDSDLNQIALRRYGGPCQGINTELLLPFD
ncbi:MAG: VWA domain-containing protein [Dehalococcoidia bacterium]